MRVVEAVCAVARATAGTIRGATVTSGVSGDGVEEMSKRVDKMHVVPRVPGSWYLKVGLYNYVLWAMYNNGSLHMLVSTRLCRELGM